MKKIIVLKTKHLLFLLLTVFIFPILSVAQTPTYRSYFGNKFTSWYTFNEFYDVSFSQMYSIEGDTILSNGINYKKLCNDFPFFARNYHWGIREEAETGSLFINKEGNMDILVSRMDLEIGDKFYFSHDMNNDENSHYHFHNIRTDENGSYYTVVDSIYYEDNRKYIRFETEYHAFLNTIRFTFIEGIGPNISFEPIVVSEVWWSICFNCYETECELWKSGFTYECLFNNMSVNEINFDFMLKILQRKGEIELQPDAGDFESGWVCVYSMQGELLYTKSAKRNIDIIIPTSSFSNGTYIIKLIEEKTKKSWSRKVII